MSTLRLSAVVVGGLAAISALAACGSGSAGTGTPVPDRTIAVTMGDNMRFSPFSLSVKAGEVVDFALTNTGQTAHEFFVGDPGMQAGHDQAMGMQGAQGMAHSTDGMVVPPAMTKHFTYHFGQLGTVLYGCHQPGHYAAGMRGMISVS
jgi:uncharacterized cupredoxin-like copper-binding protein